MGGTGRGTQSRYMQKEEFIIPKRKKKKEHLCAQPCAKCSCCKGREPYGAPSPGDMQRENEKIGPETASARGHVWQREETLEGRSRDGQESGGQLTQRGQSSLQQVKAVSRPGLSWSLRYEAERES